MEKLVFHWPLNEACTHYVDDLVYTDDAPFSNAEKKELRSYIRNHLIEQSLADDETKSVNFETSYGTVRIDLAVHPKWRRYKTIEGFLTLVERSIAPTLEQAPSPVSTSGTGEGTSAEQPRLKLFTLLLSKQLEAARWEDQGDRYVFYGVDDQVSAIFSKKAEVLGIIEGVNVTEPQAKSFKRLVKNLLTKKR